MAGENDECDPRLTHQHRQEARDIREAMDTVQMAIYNEESPDTECMRIVTQVWGNLTGGSVSKILNPSLRRRFQGLSRGRPTAKTLENPDESAAWNEAEKLMTPLKEGGVNSRFS